MAKCFTRVSRGCVGGARGALAPRRVEPRERLRKCLGLRTLRAYMVEK